jgi:3-oxoadipate enol-lactonase
MPRDRGANGFDDAFMRREASRVPNERRLLEGAAGRVQRKIGDGAVTEYAMPFAVAQDGTRIAYAANGRGAPLLLISGQSLDRTMWDGVRPALEAAFRVVVFDMRGTGASDKPDTPYSTRGFAADAVAVLDAAGIGRAHVYGFSMGGRVAQWVAIDHPERVGALVLGATSAGGTHALPKPADIDAALLHGPKSTIAAGFYSPEYLAANPGAFAPPAIPPHARRLHFAASEGHDSWADLPTITAPTLILHGTADRMIPPGNAAVLAERIAGARVALIEGARHGYFDEFREAALDLVISFLQGHPLVKSSAQSKTGHSA